MTVSRSWRKAVTMCSRKWRPSTHTSRCATRTAMTGPIRCGSQQLILRCRDVATGGCLDVSGSFEGVLSWTWRLPRTRGRNATKSVNNGSASSQARLEGRAFTLFVRDNHTKVGTREGVGVWNDDGKKGTGNCVKGKGVVRFPVGRDC